ncbi:zinc-binding alcohol dehydrogenase [Oleiphilus messinensis]|uniref:Zinc-binding alcohol dehydrogenase n=1 Tax=Oleiphilus messinensis TaxID=141451 RepID=A0A1Y0I6J1_9GAMM|nr:NAD(P)-dependent alcohol dehydrogenase [Oleiphilus messinensis]ARU56112.1 zinc-binding alcohol dehydrogenase [Oleiphilus messinensis]
MTNRAAVIRHYGSAECFEITTHLPTLTPIDNQVLVEVKAASINPLDWKIRSGQLRYIHPQRFPLVLGQDIAGVVTAVGKSVKRLKIGDRVYGMVDQSLKPSWNGFAKPGAYASLALSREDTLVTIPDVYSFEQAAATPLAALTVMQSLGKLLREKSADGKQNLNVLVNGASGGVGTFAVQMAKAYQAKITAICSERHHTLVQSLGAQQCIDYHRNDFMDEVIRQGAYDIIYDIAGSFTFKQCRPVLQKRGTFIANVPNVSSLIGSMLTPIYQIFGQHQHQTCAWVHPSASDLSVINDLITAGHIKPVIGQRFALEEITKAHQAGEAGSYPGKLIITV